MSPRTFPRINPFLKLFTLSQAFVLRPAHAPREQPSPSENAGITHADEAMRHLQQTYSLERRTFF